MEKNLLITGITKGLLFFFNLIFICSSALLIAFGVKLNKEQNLGVKYFDNFSISELSIGIGIVLLLTSLIGFYGVVRRNASALLTAYSAILMIIFFVQLSLGIVALVAIRDDDEFRNKTEQYVVEMYEDFQSNLDEIKHIQTELKCCGALDPDEMEQYLYPYCCGETATKCDEFEIYGVGCSYSFYIYIQGDTEVIGGLAIGFGVLEFLTAVLAFCIRKRTYETNSQ